MIAALPDDATKFMPMTRVERGQRFRVEPTKTRDYRAAGD